ncbi:hypothetical protein [Kribbella sp. NBC_00359]|uniref:hypothetical protein n=1 Tax=Kribbella sp. NBC_00359 TaxID=2975966 RepID=UPI002E1B44D0
MFEMDLESLSTADLLESAAEHRAEANRSDARLLEHALIYADRHHPSAHPGHPAHRDHRDHPGNLTNPAPSAHPDHSAHRDHPGNLTNAAHSAHPDHSGQLGNLTNPAHPARTGGPGRRVCDGRERAVVLGGDGCPEILEFAIAEFAVMLGISPRVAADYLGQALALRHRFPFTWARVLAGDATPWKACRIVADCAKLSEEAAAYVDQRVARLVDSITPYRLDKIVKAAKLHADPDLARAEADEQARERGVFVGRSNQHGTKTMYIKASCGAVIRHDATIADIAEALKTFGDTRPVQHRRAEAIGIIADPRYTEELLTQARHHRLHTPATTDAPADPATVAGEHVPAPPSVRVINHPAAGAPGHAAATLAATGTGTGNGSGRAWRGCDDEELLSDRTDGWAEPGLDDEVDRDAPHPSTCDLPDPLDIPDTVPIEPLDPLDPDLHIDPDDGEPLDAAAQRALHARLARIKHVAHARTACPAHSCCCGGRVRPGQTQIYVHLTDHTLATGTGTGVLRAEAIGPLLADQLAELIGHGPYTVKPVIDLNHAVSVDAYEIPDRIRERVKLTHPVELFPFGTQETHRAMDLDHLRPYDPLGPPGQTNTSNLAPLGRYGHRVKTHAHGWKVRRLDPKTLEWTTPHGFTFHVDPTGTHRVQAPRQATDRG